MTSAELLEIVTSGRPKSFRRDCVCIDFETTGLDPKNDEILQVSIVDGNERVLLSTYCKPEKTAAWPEAEKVHGITAELVSPFPPFGFFLSTIRTIIDAAPFVLAYNAGFEKAFLEAYGGIRMSRPFVDPMLMFAPVCGEFVPYFHDFKWQKLETAAAYYGYKYRAHDALNDVLATVYVFECMVLEGVLPRAV